MKPQLNRYFQHNGAKHKVSNRSGVLQVYEAWNPAPLYTLLTPASFLISNEAIQEARELLGDRKPERLQRTVNRTTQDAKDAAKLLGLKLNTINIKKRLNRWTLCESYMMSGSPVVIPNDFYRQLHMTIYRKELTRVVLGELMGICACSVGLKINNENFMPAEMYWLTKNIL